VILVGKAHSTTRPKGRVLLRRASLTLAPPFSHGIVAFNSWPLNALRGDNHWKTLVGKNSAIKTAFSSGNRGIAAIAVFRPREKLGKHPYRSWGRNRPIRENAVKTALFNATASKKRKNRACTNGRNIDTHCKPSCGSRDGEDRSLEKSKSVGQKKFAIPRRGG
jgi:hypothetical protein